MSDDTPLWALALNAATGLILIAWVFVAMGPFLLGREPILPGMDLAFLGMCTWAGWNAHLILRRKA